MNADVLLVALIAGVGTALFRYLPARLPLSRVRMGDTAGYFLASSGPAAITTLFVSSIMPELVLFDFATFRLIGGVGATVMVYVLSKSVLYATLAGALSYGLITHLWLAY